MRAAKSRILFTLSDIVYYLTGNDPEFKFFVGHLKQGPFLHSCPVCTAAFSSTAGNTHAALICTASSVTISEPGRDTAPEFPPSNHHQTSPVSRWPELVRRSEERRVGKGGSTRG